MCSMVYNLIFLEQYGDVPVENLDAPVEYLDVNIVLENDGNFS